MSQPFISYREIKNDLLCYFILQKSHPHYVGIISVGKLNDVLSSVPIAGYQLFVNFDGCLIGNFVPSYLDVIKDIDRVMRSMSDWYLANRIITDEKKYSKFKLQMT